MKRSDLPWDNKKTEAREHVPELAAEHRCKRLEEVARRLGDQINDEALFRFRAVFVLVLGLKCYGKDNIRAI